MPIQTRVMHFSPQQGQEAAQEYPPALKEIANRLKKLSFREMSLLSRLVDHQMSMDEDCEVTDALLNVSDIIEGVA
jgi:hypothetical protein